MQKLLWFVWVLVSGFSVQETFCFVNYHLKNKNMRINIQAVLYLNTLRNWLIFFFVLYKNKKLKDRKTKFACFSYCVRQEKPFQIKSVDQVKLCFLLHIIKNKNIKIFCFLNFYFLKPETENWNQLFFNSFFVSLIKTKLWLFSLIMNFISKNHFFFHF